MKLVQLIPIFAMVGYLHGAEMGPESEKITFHSPWLDFERPTWSSLTADLDADTVIVGGGISGIATLYFLLTHTQKKVVLLEKNRIASGATGHNAGIAVPHIERPVMDLIEEFGIKATEEGFQEIDAGRGDLLKICDKVGFSQEIIPIPAFSAGFCSLEGLLGWLKREQTQVGFMRTKLEYLITDEEEIKKEIPEEFSPYIRYVPQENVLSALRTTDNSYIAAAVSRASFGLRMNSAKFCYQVLHYLEKEFPDRFAIYENTEISQIELQSEGVIAKHPFGKIHAQDLILCTNGYKEFSIVDHDTQQPLTKLYDAMTPREGYLAAYSDDQEESYAIGFHDVKGYPQVPYWYLSHLPLSKHSNKYWTVLGGPEYDHLSFPSAELLQEYARSSLEDMHKFLKTTFNQTAHFEFFWHGMMGYTSSGLRWVGPDPEYPHLWYNLGCNGVGIIPAIAGAKKIARIMSGEKLKPSLFDVP